MTQRDIGILAEEGLNLCRCFRYIIIRDYKSGAIRYRAVSGGVYSLFAVLEDEKGGKRIEDITSQAGVETECQVGDTTKSELTKIKVGVMLKLN